MSAILFTITENDPVTYNDYIHGVTPGTPIPYTTVIDEPVGLDSVNLHLKRDDTYHGFLDAVDDSLGSLRFYNLAYSILKYAYQTYGMEASVSVLIQYTCDDDDSYDTLYQGLFCFDKYKEIQGLEGCYVEVGIENGQSLMLFRNRMDTRVSLDTTQAMGDGYNDAVSLTPYSGLGTQVMLNPMLMDLNDDTRISDSGDGSRLYTFGYTNGSGDYVACPGNPVFYNAPNSTDTQNNEFLLSYHNWSTVITPFTSIQSQEFGTLTGGVGDIYGQNGIPGSPAHSLTNSGWGVNNIGDPTPFFQFTSDTVYESTMVNIDIELSGAIIAGHLSATSIEDRGSCTPEISVGIYKGQNWGDVASHGANFYDFGNPNDSKNSKGCIIDVTNVLGGVTLTNDTPNGNINYFTFQYSFHTGSTPVQFNPNDKLWVLIEVANAHDITPHVVFFSGNYTYRNTYDSSWFTRYGSVVSGVTGGTITSPGVSVTTADPNYPQPTTISSITPTTPNFAITLTQDISSNSTCPYQPPSSSYLPLSSLHYIPYSSTSTFPPLSYIKLTFPSLFAATPSTAYMVNESLSRIAEITTNGTLRVYSDYFGRTDAQPYLSSTDGPGGLECITTGLLIRGYSPLAALQMSTDNPTSRPVAALYTLDPSTDLYSSSAGNILLVSGSGSTITVPEDSVGFTIGNQVILQQVGPDVTKIVGGLVSGGPAVVSVVSTSGAAATYGQNTQVLLTNVGNNSWIVSTRSTMSVSFKDLFDALHAIHAVGFSDEPDPHRSGQSLIRVEPIAHFYDPTTLMMTCDNVDIVETSVDTPNIINVFRSGYQKWEAEEAQGLDEFLSKRIFRTTLFHVRNAWDKICKFVASGYAVEATRRKLGTDTTDWRFDTENFIICLQRGGGPGLGSGATATAQVSSGGAVIAINVITAGSGYTIAPTVTLSYGGYTTPATATATVSSSSPYEVTGFTITNAGTGYTYPPTVTITPAVLGAGGFSSEQGNAVGSTSSTYSPAHGMISPPTVYNYRISPIRNALRWLRYIIASYANWTTGQLIFESGGGNYTAVGYNASVNHSGGTITIDTGLTAANTVENRLLSESDTLTMADYAGNSTSSYTIQPVYKHELVKFKYPVSYADWLSIYAYKYGYIRYSVNGGAYQNGYLQELKYNLIEGIGEFTLKPQA